MSSGSAAYDLEQMKAGALLHVKYNPTSWKRDNIFQLEQNNSNNVLTEQNELLRENESESSLDSSETESDNQGEDDNGEKVSLNWIRWHDLSLLKILLCWAKAQMWINYW